MTSQALVVDDKKFQYILRILNTNVNGKEKVMYAFTKIKGVGRRFSNLVCKKAEIDLNQRFVSFLLYLASNQQHQSICLSPQTNHE
jgi:ribosomal protein S13